jgi:hypothetical protein
MLLHILQNFNKRTTKLVEWIRIIVSGLNVLELVVPIG